MGMFVNARVYQSLVEQIFDPIRRVRSSSSGRGVISVFSCFGFCEVDGRDRLFILL